MLADVEGMSLRPSHPLSDQPLEGGGAFGRGLDIGGVDDSVTLSVQPKGELEILSKTRPPAEGIKEVPADHVDTPRDLFQASVEFSSASLNDIAPCIFASHSPGDPIL